MYHIADRVSCSGDRTGSVDSSANPVCSNRLSRTKMQMAISKNILCKYDIVVLGETVHIIDDICKRADKPRRLMIKRTKKSFSHFMDGSRPLNMSISSPRVLSYSAWSRIPFLLFVTKIIPYFFTYSSTSLQSFMMIFLVTYSSSASCCME